MYVCVSIFLNLCGYLFVLVHVCLWFSVLVFICVFVSLASVCFSLFHHNFTTFALLMSQNESIWHYSSRKSFWSVGAPKSEVSTSWVSKNLRKEFLRIFPGILRFVLKKCKIPKHNHFLRFCSNATEKSFNVWIASLKIWVLMPHHLNADPTLLKTARLGCGCN